MRNNIISDQSFIYIKWARALVLVLALSGLVACSGEPPKEAAKVVLVAPALAPAAPEATVVGTVRSAGAHDVTAQNGGRVDTLLVDVGTPVKQGQVLAVLEDRAERLSLSQAENDYRRLLATAAERQHNLTRMTALAKVDAISPADFDAAQADARAAARAAAAAADAVSLARRNLDLTVIKAPVDGIVAARPVKLSDQLAGGTTMFEIDGQGPLEIVATVPDDIARTLNEGQEIPFRQGDRVGTARLTGVSARVVGAGAREIRLTVATGQADPGAVIEILLPRSTEGRASALLPAAAISRDVSGYRALVVGKDNRLHAVSVRLLSLGAAGALVEGAIAPGDRVAAAGVSFLHAGMLVRPVPQTRL